MFIEIRDNRDKEILAQSIISSISELAKMRDKSAEWGCGTMNIQDTIDRFQYLLKEVTEAE